MPEEIRFPLSFGSCPNCGSTRRVAEMVTNEEIEKGKISSTAKTSMFNMKSLICDPDRMSKLFVPQKAIVLLAAADICVDCGTLYATSVEKGEGVLDVERPQPIGPMPSFFGKG